MKKVLLIAIFISFKSHCFSQLTLNFNQYVFGRLIGYSDTLEGYFSFEKTLSSMGQKIHYKTKTGTLFSKYLWAKDYLFFESDDAYFATCDISTPTGDIYAMLPRVVDGKLQLFEFSFKGGPANLIKTQHYYFVKDDMQNSKVTRKDFKKVMPYILFDCPQLVNKIKSGELRYSDFKEIIAEYNSIMK